MCFWAAFLPSVILRWLPATQSVVPGRLLLLLCKPKLASLEQGLVLGCVCLCAQYAHERVLANSGTASSLPGYWWVCQKGLPPPCWCQQGPMSDCFHSLCFWATFPPTDTGLWPLASIPGGGEHWIMGNVLIILPLLTSVNIGDQKLLLVTR